jgi:hypothetical protein
MDLQAHYDTMRKTAFGKLAHGEADLDTLLDSEHDTRRGITLLARPPACITSVIEALLADFQQLEPDQYYYPTSDIHLTILSIISCYQRFTLDVINPEDYQQAISTILQHIPPFRIRFTAPTQANPALLPGFQPATIHRPALQHSNGTLHRHSLSEEASRPSTFAQDYRTIRAFYYWFVRSKYSGAGLQ